MSAATLTPLDGGPGLLRKGLVWRRGLSADPQEHFSRAEPLLGPLSYETRETPALFHRLFHSSAHGVSRNPMAPLRFARMLPNRALRFGRRAGLGATPLRSDDLRPGNAALVTPVVSRWGSLPARACGAMDPCGKATGLMAPAVSGSARNTARPRPGRLTFPVTMALSAPCHPM